MAVLGAGASASRSVLQSISFTSSTTWSPAQNMYAKVYVIGGGGGGSFTSGNGCGGGAGGTAVSLLNLASGTTYTVTVGAGGTGGGGSTGAVGAGGNGGNSSFAGSGITTMTGNGGTAGSQTALTNYTFGGKAGGSASGGNYGNFTGGSSGNSRDSTQTYGNSGGGAVGLWANGVSSPAGSGTFDIGSATTGALGMGASLSGTATIRQLGQEAYYFPGLSQFYNYNGVGAISLLGMDSSGERNFEHNMSASTLQQPNSAAYSTGGNLLPSGVGGPIYDGYTATQYVVSPVAGYFAGGGTATERNVSGVFTMGGAASLGGGGGGSLRSPGYRGYGGEGGTGCVIIEVLEYSS